MILLEQYFAWRGGARPFTHGAQSGFIAQQIDGVTRHGLHVTDVGQKSAYAMLDHFRHSSGAGGNRNHLTGHSFQCRQSE